MTPVTVQHGSGPIVLGIPHAGTYIPDAIWPRLNATGQELADTDWWINRLYQGLFPDLTIVKANFHRYVIDANRDPTGVSLYPSQNTTGLVPLTDFDGNEIWLTPPNQAETEERLESFHVPYHTALAEALAAARRRHGVAILYDCHSIRSKIPFLFENTLPDFNIGTNMGVTCSNVITQEVENVCKGASDYSTVTNGRFKGGWSTRHYGQPCKGEHAIQMELAQSTYMIEAAPWTYDDEKAAKLRCHLKDIFSRLDRLVREGHLT